MESAFLVHPRPKRSALPPPSKKRKQDHKIEQIDFDFSKREEYLTGFHKRKLQRVKNAQAEAAKKEREEKVQMRKQLREERKKELEEHVQSVNALLQDARGQETEEGSNEWSGIEEDGNAAPELVINHEEEYVDEDRYTTVTVEAVDVDKEGLRTAVEEAEDSEEGAETRSKQPESKDTKTKKTWPKKTKKKKFRYETKTERKATRAKQKAGRRSRADARKGND